MDPLMIVTRRFFALRLRSSIRRFRCVISGPLPSAIPAARVFWCVKLSAPVDYRVTVIDHSPENYVRDYFCIPAVP